MLERDILIPYEENILMSRYNNISIYQSYIDISRKLYFNLISMKDLFPTKVCNIFAPRKIQCSRRRKIFANAISVGFDQEGLLSKAKGGKR